MTRFLASEPRETQGYLSSLAEAALRASSELGARIVGPLQRGEDLPASLVDANELLGTSLSREMIDLALANAGNATVDARANKLAFQLLTTVPASPVAQLLSSVAARAFRRAGPALGPFLDAEDLLSLLRWKLWTLPAEHFVAARILKNPGLAAYLSVIARRIVIDECRAMENRGRADIEPETLESFADPRTRLDAILDDLDLLQRFASELPEWQAPIVEVLAGQAERGDALRTINRKREAAALSPWSAESMRTAVHRARKRLRELLLRTPSRLMPEPRSPSAASTPALHAWRRFWCARDGSYSLLDGGFLIDPETEYGRHIHGVVALDRLEHVPCLVLLGEPGIGKSTAIRQELQRLTNDARNAALVDLARTSGGDPLVRSIERAGATDESPVYLFFDALDEGLLRNRALSSELIAILGTLDRSRVQIRIACRTLEWPADLEAELRQRYGAEALCVHELVPLRRIDVIVAANDEGIDGVEFVREVRERDAVALAIRPISLRFLVAMFAADGTLPHSKARLFDEGTLILCSEEGAVQRGRYRRTADVFRRRAIAARLAIASTFTNRHAIIRGECREDAELPASIAIGMEELPDATYPIDRSAVEDVLAGTALFAARTLTSFGWNHQSYREFLAAWYLAQHGIGVEAADRLYLGEGVARIPGPLREVAAWHATFVPALFDWLVERDPEVLLHSDGAAASAEARAQLVGALLDRMARYEALDNYHSRDYQKLEYPQLGDQLRHYITDRDANIIVRRAAMSIAWSCSVRDVINDLVAVLVDAEDDLHAREVAARALAELGGDQVRDTFVALLAAGFTPDPNDNIRGNILSFLWPDHVDAPTLFRHLLAPQRDDYLGAYQRFLTELPAGLKPEHLRLALEWVEAIDVSVDCHLLHAQHEIIDIALRFVDREDVRDVLVRIIRACLGGHHGAWYAEVSVHSRGERLLATTDRQLIARDLIVGATHDERIGRELLYFDPPLIGSDDIGWIVELASASDEHLQRTCGRCIAAIYAHYGYPIDALVADAVVSIEAPAFQEPLRPFFTPVELGSESARELADSWAYVRRRSPTVPDNKPSVPTRWSVASPCLARIEAGDLTGWVDFVARWIELLSKPIAESDEWVALAPHDRERIVLAGLRYLRGSQAPDLSWLDVRNEFPWSAVAARSALQLIAALRPAMLDGIAEPVWRRWCPVLVALPFPTMSIEVCRELFRRCATCEELATAIVRVGRRDNQLGGHVSMLLELPDPLPRAIHAPLLALAPEFGDDAFEDALALLLRAGNEAAREFACTTLRDAAFERAARAARVLLPYDSTQWSVVIARMQRERGFIDAFAPLVDHPRFIRDNPFSTLRPQQAAELYLVLLREYPPDENRRGPQGELTLLDHIEDLRGRMISMLVEAGSDEAIRALEWLRDQAMGREILRYHLVRARQNLADATWEPLSVDGLWSALDAGLGTAPRHGAGPPRETVPPETPPAPERRDASRDEVMGLLANVHVLVETATSIETAAVHASMKPLPGEDALVVGSAGIATYTVGMLGNYAVAHFQSDMGNESPNGSQLATNDAIVEARPKLILLVGIAFGLHPTKQRLGDVLVAQHITSYEMVKLRPDCVEERGETLRTDVALIERFQAHGRTWRFGHAGRSSVAIHVGQLLSGAKLVNNREFRDALVRRFPTALGGEMEGVGAYAAAFRRRVPVLLVKAICDWADGTKADDAQPFAAMAAIDLVRHVLERPDALAAIGVVAHH